MFPERFAPVLAELQPLADRFTAAGHRLFIVGGMVRDLLLNRFSGGDFDLTTEARPDEIKKLLSGWADAVWNQGEKFGTIGARKGERTYEITTHRGESYTPESRKPEVTFSDDIEMDLSRRDFTVNAMALEVTSASPTLVDPFGGSAHQNSAHTSVAGDQLQRRSAADDASGPLRRWLPVDAGARAGGGREGDARTHRNRVRRADT